MLSHYHLFLCIAETGGDVCAHYELNQNINMQESRENCNGNAAKRQCGCQGYAAHDVFLTGEYGKHNQRGPGHVLYIFFVSLTCAAISAYD